MKYKLCDWVLEENLDWHGLSFNPSDGAVELLLKNPEKINLSDFSANTNDRAVEYLISNPHKIRWSYFSQTQMILLLIF